MSATNVRDTQYSQIIAFLSEYLKVPKSKVLMNQSLFHDFGVDGDDAIELIQDYAEKFNVSLNNFRIEEYFGPELSSPFHIIVEFITRRKFKNTPRLTVEDLINGVKHGQLMPNKSL